ncbi:MAG: hypothetical protein ABI876_00545 [Bacteroidota bacterium]
MISRPLFQSPLTQRIADFLVDIGIEIRSGNFTGDTFLPGIQVNSGGLLADESLMTYPGDLLHEAGHLAVVSPERRRGLHTHVGDDPAEEMMAIAWSYAAAVYLAIDPAVLFHSGGYKGGGEGLVESFTGGRTFGVPMLAWIGLTADGARARELGVPPYPHMIRWVLEGNPGEG